MEVAFCRVLANCHCLGFSCGFDQAAFCRCVFFVFSYFFYFWLPRTGNAIAAFLGDGHPVVCYLVLTLWPRMQKPKPAPSKVALGQVKCFRAVQLVPHTDQPEVLLPTNNVVLLESANVLALLDCVSSDLSQGRIAISPASVEMLQKMQSDDFQCPRVPSKRKKVAAKTIRKRAAAKVQKMMKKKQGSMSAKPAAAPKKVDAAAMDSGDQITASNLRRSAAGRVALQNALKRIMHEEVLKFPDSPTFSQTTNLCTLSGLDSFTRKDFLAKAPKYFECKYAFGARSPAAYGERVFSDLVQINRELLAAPVSRTRWVALVRDIAKVMDARAAL